MFEVRHTGLIFSARHIESARKQAQRPPFAAAWAMLRDKMQVEALATAQWLGLRYRFDEDAEAGQRGAALLDTLCERDMAAQQRAALDESVTLAQCIELLRDSPGAAIIRWGDALHDRLQRLAASGDDDDLVARLHLGLLHMATGIVLERETLVTQGAGVLRAAIDNEVHPEGYIPRAVETNAESGLRDQLLSVQAFILMAEAARHVGIDLWGYNNRGVSVATAATYPLYYYFYPVQWKWGEKAWVRGEGLQEEVLTPEAAQRVFARHNGMLEILNHHMGQRPLKAVRLILADLRPVYDLHGGGLTTLTHGVAEGRRGLFGG